MIPHHSKRLETLADTCAEKAWRVAMSLLGDTHEAYDAVQQAFLVAARKSAQIPASDPWPWFAQVVAYEARNLRRKKRPATISNGPGSWLDNQAAPATIDPSRVLEDSELREHLTAAMRGLPWKEREAITLTRVAGLSHDEAARVMDMPRKTLTSHVLRGVDRLRDSLAKHGRDGDTLLAACPLMMPNGGLEAALAGWKAAALTVPAGTAATVATAASGAMLMKNMVVIGGLALAAGLAGGYFANTLVESEPEVIREVPPEVKQELEQARLDAAKAGERARAESASRIAERESAIAGLKIDLEAANKRIEAGLGDRAELEAAVAKLRSELDKAMAEVEKKDGEVLGMRAANEALQKELSVLGGSAQDRAPVFSFGEFGSLDGVVNANWKEIAVASRAVGDAIARRYTAIREGRRPSREDSLIIQENTERVRKYEYRTIGKLPSFALHNGELTHPISLTNTIAAILQDNGADLTEDQISQFTRLGEAWEKEDAARRKLYGPATPRAKKMLDEYVSKGVFTDALLAALTSHQKSFIVNPVTHRVAGLDLLCPTLMIVHTTTRITVPDAAAMKAKLAEEVVKAFKLSEAQTAQLGPLVDAWALEVASLTTPLPRGEERYYTFDEGVVAGRAVVNLYQQMLTVFDLSDESRSLLLDSHTWFIPRLLSPAPPTPGG